MMKRFAALFGVVVLASLTPALARAASGAEGADAEIYQRTVAKGISFLRTKGQHSDGSYSSHAGTGITSLATTALLRLGQKAESPEVALAFEIP